MKARGSIDVEQGREEHKKLMEAFLEHKLIKVETDYFKGYIQVLSADSWFERRTIITAFEIVGCE